MKKIIFMMMAVFAATFLSADTIEQNVTVDGYNVKVYTNNTPISGNNEFFVKLTQNGTVVEDAKMKIKVFMQKCQVCLIWIIKQKLNWLMVNIK